MQKKSSRVTGLTGLTGASLFHQVTGTQVVRVDGDGLLSNPELGGGLLTGDRVDLQLLS